VTKQVDPQVAPPPRRRRLPAAEARARILGAAQERLRDSGPQGLRLADVARDLGVTHQAILHHFESREGLLQELVRESFAELGRGLVEAFETRAGGQLEPRELLEQVFRTFDEGGHARVMAWLNLSGLSAPGDAPPDHLMRGIAEALEARRTELGAEPDFERTLFTALLVGIVAFGDSVVGEAMRGSAGFAGDAAVVDRFREWLAQLIVSQLA